MFVWKYIKNMNANLNNFLNCVGVIVCVCVCVCV